MDVLPRACAGLLLLSLLCATGLCQRSKSECSPWYVHLWSLLGTALRGLCTPLLGSGDTAPHVDKSLGDLSCAFPPVFYLPSSCSPSLATPLLFCSQLPLTTQPKTSTDLPRKGDQPFSCPPMALLVFSIPYVLIFPCR